MIFIPHDFLFFPARRQRLSKIDGISVDFAFIATLSLYGIRSIVKENE